MTASYEKAVVADGPPSCEKLSGFEFAGHHSSVLSEDEFGGKFHGDRVLSAAGFPVGSNGKPWPTQAGPKLGQQVNLTFYTGRFPRWLRNPDLNSS